MTDERDAAPDDEIAAPAASGRRGREPLILLLIAAGVAGVLFAASAVPVALSRDDGDGARATASSSRATEGDDTTDDDPNDGAGDDETLDDATAPTTDPEPTTTTVPATTEPVGATAPTTPAADVPESVAVVLGGQIFLEGAVPDEESRTEIVELATGIFGADNVIDNYVIDERATDPNLGNIRVDDAVLFAADSAQIAPEFEPLLNQGLALLTIRPSATFLIEGHTDSLGGEQYNLELSQARADAVVRWWVDRGVDPVRLTAVGRGQTDPIASNDTQDGRERNRRIEVTIENLLVDG